ncbi:hypothetical protein BT96DRAFT_959417 [Gymnopus androsaceus JB14]|uniref:Uncharacterized protein n=1 Tax=Gymnopus androsaceus JB14 TaxID=1447944 RepID=A0A6A4H2W9_9AGAR|nr:hypothetical protein BT96DRAFT_959417 [Gymnopus androsaceus JB14]
MHLLFENVVKNLVLLWTSSFKKLDEGTSEYEFLHGVWDAVGEATYQSGSTIPGAFGPRPPNVADDTIACIADSWCFWLLYIGPVVLYNRFRKQVYYNHFVKLSHLIHLCLQFEYSHNDIQKICTGFKEWVEEYEKLYYQYLPERLATCPLTIHALLHIADSIKWAAPVWACWAFPMERYCGHLQCCIKSRRYPFASIDNYVTASAQLSHIKIIYGLVNELNLKHPTCILLPPRRPSSTVTTFWRDKIILALATRFETSVQRARQFLHTADIQRWGKVRQLEGGDDMNASSLVTAAEDRRDATYVRYEMLVDRFAHSRKKKSSFVLTTFFGQLQELFVVSLPPIDELGLSDKTTLILAGIQRSEINKFHATGLFSSQKLGLSEVVDITCVQCLIGRIAAGAKGTVVLDRTGVLQWATYAPDT